MKLTLLYIICALIIGGLFGAMNWPIWIALLLLFCISLVEIVRIFYTAYYSKNLLQITKFVDRYKKNPIYMYAHILREGSDEEILMGLEKIVQKYKQPTYQASFGAQLYFLQGEKDAAIRIVKPVENREIGQYTLALVEALSGNEELALNYKLEKPWMQHSIIANIAFSKGDTEVLEREAKLAIEHSRGVQRYSNYYTFKRMIEKSNRKIDAL